MAGESRPILVVDDDAPTLKLLQAVLGRCGYESVTASNGAEAITLLKANSYMAVVLDMMMPAVGGRDVIAFLADTTNPTPVVICSAAGTSALTGLNGAVVKSVVRKPFDIDELMAAVKAIAG